MKNIFFVILAVVIVSVGYISFSGEEGADAPTVVENDLLPVAGEDVQEPEAQSKAEVVAQSAEPVVDEAVVKTENSVVVDVEVEKVEPVSMVDIEDKVTVLESDDAPASVVPEQEGTKLTEVTFINNGNEDDEYEESNIQYNTPTMKNFSQMYWALGKLDINDDAMIDTFLFINECDLYKNYFNNEFEWSKIRAKAREVIIKEKRDYPVRYEFLQPLNLSTYNLETKKFEISDSKKIRDAKNIEVMVKDQDASICTHNSSGALKGYQKGVAAELSRPFTLIELPLSPELAELYIKAKNKIIKDERIYVATSKDLKKHRDAYLLMKVKFFSYKGEIRGQDYNLSKFLAVLEGYEVYADQEMTQLLYAENYLRKKKRSKMELELKRKYKERLKKQIADKKAAQAKKAAEQP